MARLAAIVLLILMPAAAAAGLFVAAPDSVPEGTAFMVTVSAPAGSPPLEAAWLGHKLHPAWAVAGEGLEARLLLGLGMREKLEGDEHELELRCGDEIVLRSIRRAPRSYPEQHLDVPRKYTELSEENLARHERERAAVREALDRVSPGEAWSLPLTRPVPGEVSSDFGLRRFFNGEPKQPHGGVDLRGAEGTPVRACADGVVTLAGDHFFAGGSVYLDHGQGLVSMAFHLSEILVKEGQRVRRGQIIGRIGETGRVTGPHLHWGVSLQGQLVDPLLLLDNPAPGP